MKALLGLGVIAFVALLIGLIALWPLAIIWSLNTLFSQGIAYTFSNWLAALVLLTLFGSAKVTSSKS